MASMSITSSSLRTTYLKLPFLSSSYSKPFFFSSSSISFTSFKPFTFHPKSNTTPPPPPPPSIHQFPPKLQEIITLFQATQDPRSKYQQLLFYANNLPPLSPSHKTLSNKVQGCVSQVWVHASLDHQNLVFFQADSDSVMTKGLAALLVLGLSGLPVKDVVQVSPDFITLLGLQHSLTPSRNNGFFNMFKLMQQKALLLGLECEKRGDNGPESLSLEVGGGDNGAIESGSISGSADEVVGGVNGPESLSLEVGGSENGENGAIESGSIRVSVDEVNVGANGPESLNLEVGRSENGVIESGWESSSAGELVGVNGSGGLNPEVGGSENGVIESSSNSGTRGERIREKLEKELRPIEIEVEDISYQHAGHVGVKGSDRETHFNLKIVSDEFEGKSLVKRHRIIYGLLQDELESGLHALSIVAKTPAEAQEGK